MFKFLFQINAKDTAILADKSYKKELNRRFKLIMSNIYFHIKNESSYGNKSCLIYDNLDFHNSDELKNMVFEKLKKDDYKIDYVESVNRLIIKWD